MTSSYFGNTSVSGGGAMTDAEVKTAYEANANTNAFTDVLLSKLNAIEAGAKDDQTAAEIEALLDAYLGGTDWRTGGAGASAFTDLTDTPVGYGTAGQVPVVNGTADGIVWEDMAAGGGGSSSFLGFRAYAAATQSYTAFAETELVVGTVAFDAESALTGNVFITPASLDGKYMVFALGIATEASEAGAHYLQKSTDSGSTWTNIAIGGVNAQAGLSLASGPQVLATGDQYRAAFALSSGTVSAGEPTFFSGHVVEVGTGGGAAVETALQGFSVNKVGGSVSASSATRSTIKHENVIHDPELGYDIATGEFTVPAAYNGLWMVFVGSVFYSGSSSWANITLEQDGVDIVTLQLESASSRIIGLQSNPVQVLTGQVFRLTTTTATGRDVQADIRNFFSGYVVGGGASSLVVDPNILPNTDYANPQGTGDRLADFTFTSNAINFNSDGSSLFNGSYSNQDYLNGATVGSAYIQIEFPTRRVITESRWRQQNTAGQGVWKWEGSNDGTTFVDLSSEFNLAGATITDHTLDLITDSYTFYRLSMVSGTVSNSPYIYELEFSIDDGTSEFIYALPDSLGALVDVDTTGGVSGNTLVQQGDGTFAIGVVAEIPEMPAVITAATYATTDADFASGKTIRRINNAASCDVTVTAGHTSSGVLTIIQTGTGAVSFIEDTGVSIVSLSNLASTSGAGSVVSLIPDADTADLYYLVGGLA